MAMAPAPLSSPSTALGVSSRWRWNGSLVSRLYMVQALVVVLALLALLGLMARSLFLPGGGALDTDLRLLAEATVFNP